MCQFKFTQRTKIIPGLNFLIQLCDGGYQNQLVEDTVVDMPTNCVAVSDDFLETAYHRPSNGGNMAQTRVKIPLEFDLVLKFSLIII